MKTKRTLWRAIGAAAIIAIIGFGVAGCDNNNGTPVLHTVTFNTHGGSAVQSQAVEEGHTAAMPAAPTRADYNFVGWFTAQTGGTEFNFNTPITGPTTVHAQWQPVQSSPDTLTIVTFNTHGGSDVESQEVEEGDTATRPYPDPTKAGYDFVGWFTTETGGEEFDFDTPITGPTTIHAQWEPVQQTPVQHTVTFNTHGGSAVENEEVEDGQRATRPPTNPTRAGHVFAGWFTEPTGGDPFDFDADITADTTIHAQWLETMGWTAIPAGDGGSTFTDNITGVAYGSGRGIAVCWGGRMAHSDDGINWTAIPAGDGGSTFTDGINGVAYGSGRWVAVGGHWGRMAHSDDGINWTAIPGGIGGSTFSGEITGVAYGSGRWVAVGGGGRMAHSADGISWTAIPAGIGGSTFGGGQSIRGVAYGNGRWVAVGHWGQMAHSTNGTSWTAIPAGDGGSTFTNTNIITGVAYGSGRWVAVGTGGGRMAYSADGTSWTAIPAGDGGSTFTSTIRGVAYGSGRWVAVGDGGRMAHSADGTSWTAIPAGAASTFNVNITGVAYGNGRWVAVGEEGRMAYFTEE